jgi:hypothetical protein
MAMFTPYSGLPLPWPSEELEFEVLKLEFIPHSGLVFVHTNEFVCHLPKYWSTKCDLTIKVPYWNKLPNKCVRCYWLSEDEICWELWAQNRLRGWWSKLYD